MSVALWADRLIPAQVAGAVALATATPAPPSGAPARPSPGTPSATPPVIAAERYLAPDGSDEAAGTLEAPWRTLDAAQRRLRPGDTLWVRGGTHAAREVDWTASGTPAAPITIRAYPGERPTFDGGGSEDRFLWLHDGAGWLDFRDLTLTGFATSHTGVIVLSDGAHDVRFQGLDIRGNPTGTAQDHLVYLSAPGVHDVTIEASTLTGASGAAIHVYHEPAARGIRILDNDIRESHSGIVLYSGTEDVLIRGNRFAGNAEAVKLERATGVVIVGNEATGGDGLVVVGPPIEASYVEEDNLWPGPLRLQRP